MSHDLLALIALAMAVTSPGLWHWLVTRPQLRLLSLTGPQIDSLLHSLQMQQQRIDMVEAAHCCHQDELAAHQENLATHTQDLTWTRTIRDSEIARGIVALQGRVDALESGKVRGWE